MEYCSRALPSFDRCDRPSADVSSKCGAQPGGFAQGPDEKKGRSGFMVGFAAHNVAAGVAVSVNITLLAESTRRVGTAWPGAAFTGDCGARKASAKDSRPNPGLAMCCAAQQLDFAGIDDATRSDPSVHRVERTTRPAMRARRLNLLTIRKQCR
jgi:hypothetical protein